MFKQDVLSEVELIKLAQTGNKDAFGELYERHLSAMQKFIRSRVDEPNEAEDIAQTVFIKAWRALERYRPSSVPFRAWLYRIAQNTIIDHYRSNKQETSLDTDSPLPAETGFPEEIVMSREHEASVRAAVTQLRPDYQSVISLRFFNGLDYTETAAKLGRKVNAVRVLQYRALGALQKVLVDQSVSWVLVGAVVLTFGVSTTIVQASRGALPGDVLFPVKTTVESTQLALANDETDLELYLDFAQRRLAEIEQLTADNRSTDIPTAVDDLRAKLDGLSDTLTTLNTANDEQSDIRTSEVEALLTDQTTQLNVLLEQAADEVQGVLQEAIDSIEATQSNLTIIPIPDSEETDEGKSDQAPTLDTSEVDTNTDGEVLILGADTNEVIVIPLPDIQDESPENDQQPNVIDDNRGRNEGRNTQQSNRQNGRGNGSDGQNSPPPSQDRNGSDDAQNNPPRSSGESGQDNRPDNDQNDDNGNSRQSDGPNNRDGDGVNSPSPSQENNQSGANNDQNDTSSPSGERRQEDQPANDRDDNKGDNRPSEDASNRNDDDSTSLPSSDDQNKGGDEQRNRDDNEDSGGESDRQSRNDNADSPPPSLSDNKGDDKRDDQNQADNRSGDDNRSSDNGSSNQGSSSDGNKGDKDKKEKKSK
ncbi:MAG: sigma-70 family RNA polymerase sigma factor [Chloroflexota bacterium]